LFSERKQNFITGERGNSFIFTFSLIFGMFKVQNCLLFHNCEQLHGIDGIDISTNNFSKILSLCVSYFTSVYVMKWKDFFPNKELKEPPYFDARAVCYPNLKTIRDYLAWRQVDCKLLKLKSKFSHIANETLFCNFFCPEVLQENCIISTKVLQIMKLHTTITTTTT